MATDAFSQQIVNLVRKMPDEAILALVKNQLGAVTGEAPLVPPAAPRRSRARARAAGAVQSKTSSVAAKRGAAPKRRPGRPRKSPAASAERQETLDAVERVVKASSGVSASEVAKQAGIPQTRAAAALKELKLEKRIFQGGDRRFARYAGDAKTAEQASANARKTAAGPAPVVKKPSAKGRKRVAPAAAPPK
ncbi:hypothetical protein [Sorangium cellulosum]|uniref:DNA-binding protein n=1 Tax=Sorangium cellulosum (strain So ce56) TaxID=448385 RepID=A9FGL6_SORC5|nr:hypothetical protein [Sorangium cellulosum]CAN98132.1 hypothetical protein predicted by Glimmer/Critica [Sorangium cellulosum So ce56]